MNRVFAIYHEEKTSWDKKLTVQARDRDSNSTDLYLLFNSKLFHCLENLRTQSLYLCYYIGRTKRKSPPFFTFEAMKQFAVEQMVELSRVSIASLNGQFCCDILILASTLILSQHAMKAAWLQRHLLTQLVGECGAGNVGQVQAQVVSVGQVQIVLQVAGCRLVAGHCGTFCFLRLGGGARSGRQTH